MGRHPSTISRELRRNAQQKPHWYRPSDADDKTRGRRRRSRRNLRFTAMDLLIVRACLELLWSSEQIVGTLRVEGLLHVSHETIYRHIWEDRRCGGSLYLVLRGARKQKWKRYRAYDSRGRVAGKRHISERPAAAPNRSRVGHLEGDTMIGAFDRHCVLTLVDRKTGYVMMESCSVGPHKQRTGGRLL